ncbi:MAG: TRAP transporter large permease [Proteobacteria bacterium]|nr:TRAP transporter large permease [Pseudomonadota bacterium]
MLVCILILITLMAFLGAPIFIVLSAYAMTGFFYADIPMAAITVDVYNNFSNNPLLYTIPLFTFAGYILAESKASIRLVNVSQAFLGFVPGGLALVSLISCAFFTAFSGASGVTIVALGGLLFPALTKEKYPESFSLGLLTSSGSLGLLFVPSLPLIMYSVVAETSITQTFCAGLIPGVLLIVILSFYSAFVAGKHRIERSRPSLSSLVDTAWEAKWELMIPLIIIGGLFGGVVTLGEVATLTVLYSLVVEVLICKDIPIQRVFDVMVKSISLSGGLLIIMGSAYGLTNYMVDAQVPMIILDAIRSVIDSRLVFLMVLNVFLLIVGCFLDIYSAIFVVVPLIVPLARSYDVNLIHLGIIFLANLEIGYSTPPVGMNLFIAALRFDRSILSLYKATLPFILLLLVGLGLITYLPFLSLGLIDYLGIK